MLRTCAIIRRTPDAGSGIDGCFLHVSWCEDACQRFSAAQIDELEAAAESLHQLCLEALAQLIDAGRLGVPGIPPPFHTAVASSFWRRDFSLYGRFDPAYDGVNPPRMLEYNADTPTSPLESDVAQWAWMEEVFPRARSTRCTTG